MCERELSQMVERVLFFSVSWGFGHDERSTGGGRIDALHMRGLADVSLLSGVAVAV